MSNKILTVLSRLYFLRDPSPLGEGAEGERNSRPVRGGLSFRAAARQKSARKSEAFLLRESRPKRERRATNITNAERLHIARHSRDIRRPEGGACGMGGPAPRGARKTRAARAGKMPACEALATGVTLRAGGLPQGAWLRAKRRKSKRKQPLSIGLRFRLLLARAVRGAGVLHSKLFAEGVQGARSATRAQSKERGVLF